MPRDFLPGGDNRDEDNDVHGKEGLQAVLKAYNHARPEAPLAALMFDLCSGLTNRARNAARRIRSRMNLLNGLQGLQHLQQATVHLRLEGRPRTRLPVPPIPGMKVNTIWRTRPPADPKKADLYSARRSDPWNRTSPSTPIKQQVRAVFITSTASHGSSTHGSRPLLRVEPTWYHDSILDRMRATRAVRSAPEPDEPEFRG